MVSIPYSKLKRGTLLIASPNIEDEMFFRSVVLLCDCSSIGSFGMIINKPLDTQVRDEILLFEGFSDMQLNMRSGGPHQLNQIMLLHSFEEQSSQSLFICPKVYLGGNFEFLREKEEAFLPSSFFLTLGYTSWGAGHLEKEFLKGTWFLHPASFESIFEMPPEKMWQTLLREMGGKYKTLSMMPEDLDFN